MSVYGQGRNLCSWLALLGMATLVTSAAAATHRFKMLSSQRVRSIMRCSDIESLRTHDFPGVLKERVPGTPGHEEVRKYIVSRLSQLNCSRWNITEHSFEDDTPLGRKPFTNIIATLDPHVSKRLVLAAHYDSKILTGKQFLAATDSALPVALLLDLALTLDEKLLERELADYSLQLIFTDGEEAFRYWTATDSLYGARRLATDMAGELLSVEDNNGLEAMTAFVLLDLIGAASPSFHDMYEPGSQLFQRMVKIERRLHDDGHLEGHSSHYFNERTAYGLYHIEDDHKPFLDKGVPIVHLIAYPFPHMEVYL
ncbi:glutaminyl-peptide cyclotransferase-like isoform X2 [Halichondria panicea]|uniref:glutaminyl-peptide cyclotransferase-like isoform X2 n=1 Tax=Halichondria panicea TaxID=6063 RepID=UPI00312B5625